MGMNILLLTAALLDFAVCAILPYNPWSLLSAAAGGWCLALFVRQAIEDLNA